jgi:hypothetical protein
VQHRVGADRNGPVRQFEPPLGHQEKRDARIKVGGLTGRLETLRKPTEKSGKGSKLDTDNAE